MDMTQPDAIKDLPPAHSLGAILVEAGRLTLLEAGRVRQLQKQQQGFRFGEAARQLGLLDDEDVLFALTRQFAYPCLRPGHTGVSHDVLAAFGSRHPLVERLRDLRANVMLYWQGREGFREAGRGAARKSLAVVSARRGEGKSFIAANLAVLFAQSGQRTLLVDAALITPCQHRLFNLDNRRGLSSALCGLAGLEDAAAVPGLVDLAVLPAGPTPPNPRELLSRPRFASLLAQAGQAFDVVVIDTPSVAQAADAQNVAAQAGISLLVSRPNAATVAETARLTTALDNLLGAVVNQF